jgi:hypothetical protein
VNWRGPRTGAREATDGLGRSGYADRPPGFLPLTCHFRMPARCLRLPGRRPRAECRRCRGPVPRTRASHRRGRMLVGVGHHRESQEMRTGGGSLPSSGGRGGAVT